MVKENFKVGDKVKLCNPTSVVTEKTIGRIVEIKGQSGILIRVLWDIDNCMICKHSECGIPVKTGVYRPNTIKKLIVKGEQLLFEFMNS